MSRTSGSVLQVDGSWYARVTFRDETGRRKERRKKATSWQEAKGYRDDLLLELKEHGVAAAGSDKVTFQELSEARLSNDLVARLLGHTQSRMTFRYTNLTETTAKRAAELLTGRQEGKQGPRKLRPRVRLVVSFL
jgi:kynurenine formamidase